MGIQTFEDLEVWQYAHQLVLDIYQKTKRFPSEEQYGLISQCRRSSASVCANIAEGCRKSTKDFVRYLDIARGSLEETRYHLILARDLTYLSESDYNDMHHRMASIARMLSGLKRSLLRSYDMRNDNR